MPASSIRDFPMTRQNKYSRWQRGRLCYFGFFRYGLTIEEEHFSVMRVIISNWSWHKVDGSARNLVAFRILSGNSWKRRKTVTSVLENNSQCFEADKMRSKTSCRRSDMHYVFILCERLWYPDPDTLPWFCRRKYLANNTKNRVVLQKTSKYKYTA